MVDQVLQLICFWRIFYGLKPKPVRSTGCLNAKERSWFEVNASAIPYGLADHREGMSAGMYLDILETSGKGLCLNRREQSFVDYTKQSVEGS